MSDIHRVLASDSSSRSNRGDGPMGEVNFWKERYGKITSIAEQLKRDDFRPVIEMIKGAHSDVHERWRKMDHQLTDDFNEAKV